jgi:hypothetical protein
MKHHKMYEKICKFKGCKNVFITFTNKKIYCSEACRLADLEKHRNKRIFAKKNTATKESRATYDKANYLKLKADPIWWAKRQEANRLAALKHINKVVSNGIAPEKLEATKKRQAKTSHLYYLEHKAAMLAKTATWQKTEEGKAYAKDYYAKNCKNNPEYLAARRKAYKKWYANISPERLAEIKERSQKNYRAHREAEVSKIIAEVKPTVEVKQAAPVVDKKREALELMKQAITELLGGIV